MSSLSQDPRKPSKGARGARQCHFRWLFASRIFPTGREASGPRKHDDVFSRQNLDTARQASVKPRSPKDTRVFLEIEVATAPQKIERSNQAPRHASSDPETCSKNDGGHALEKPSDASERNSARNLPAQVSIEAVETTSDPRGKANFENKSSPGLRRSRLVVFCVGANDVCPHCLLWLCCGADRHISMCCSVLSSSSFTLPTWQRVAFDARPGAVVVVGRSVVLMGRGVLGVWCWCSSRSANKKKRGSNKDARC